MLWNAHITSTETVVVVVVVVVVAAAAAAAAAAVVVVGSQSIYNTCYADSNNNKLVSCIEYEITCFVMALSHKSGWCGRRHSLRFTSSTSVIYNRSNKD